ncbi:hypothetical protein [Roseospirillum parvum]|uniref:Uncharacterized protein n=1 Tax=Roseospirillum parvum TaxID=83401 RepID=A0A1G8CYJ6_9PROT|nr:hypothetical protein [Roseospirillum parvum]SDH49990.1 hypothetical protein SAMN05421742_107122 [Roseospirillum parvum]
MSTQSAAQVQPAVASATQRSSPAVRAEGLGGAFGEITQISPARGLGPRQQSVDDQRFFGSNGGQERQQRPALETGGVSATLPRFSQEVARLLVQVQTTANTLTQAGTGAESTAPARLPARQGVAVYQRYMRYLAAA